MSGWHRATVGMHLLSRLCEHINIIYGVRGILGHLLVERMRRRICLRRRGRAAGSVHVHLRHVQCISNYDRLQRIEWDMHAVHRRVLVRGGRRTASFVHVHAGLLVERADFERVHWNVRHVRRMRCWQFVLWWCDASRGMWVLVWIRLIGNNVHAMHRER